MTQGHLTVLQRKMFQAVFFFLVLLVSALADPSENTTNSAPVRTRIIGGRKAGPNDALYQVSFRTADQYHRCGGAILNARTIITAAHCVDDVTPKDVIVMVGSNQLNSGTTKYDVSRLISHPDYEKTHYTNDIALIITKTRITFTSKVKAIPLSTKFTGEDVTVKLTGWGRTAYPSYDIPNDLQLINLRTISIADCKAKFPNSIKSQICTFTQAGQGACFGDSGGPLVGPDEHLVGLASYVIPCARGFPDVFTRISSFVPWINKNSRK